MAAFNHQEAAAAFSGGRTAHLSSQLVKRGPQ